MAQSPWLPTRAGTRRGWAEDGITLIEMMVAILILGVIMSAFARTLIGSLQQVVSNERRVVATALNNQVLEQILALPFDVIGIYADDPNHRATATLDGTTYDTVTIPAADPDDPRVPTAQRTETRSDVDYQVRVDVLWVDVDGDGTDDTKRVVSTLSWTDSSGEARTEQAVGERVATDAELGERFGVLRLESSPAEVPVDNVDEDEGSEEDGDASLIDDGVDDDGDGDGDSDTTEDLTFTVEFRTEASSAVLTYDSLLGSDRQLSLGVDDADGTLWSGTIPAGNEQFAPGPTEFTLTANSPTGETVTETITVTFTGENSGATDPDSFEIEEVVVQPNPITITDSNQTCGFDVTVDVEGFDEFDAVDVEYSYWSNANGGGNTPDERRRRQTLWIGQDGDGDGIFRLTVAGSSDEHFRKNQPFAVQAFASPAGTDQEKSSDVIQVSANQLGNNESCP